MNSAQPRSVSLSVAPKKVKKNGTKNNFLSSKVTFELGEYQNIIAKGPLLDTVYRLRYESYSEQNYIDKNDTKLFIDEFDSKPNCTSYLTLHNHTPIGSIRSCLYDPSTARPAPIMEVFEDEIGQQIGYDKAFMEFNKFVVSPEFQRQGGVVARFMIVENVARAAQQAGVNFLVIAVREEHLKYYNAVFGFEQASDVKSYPHLSFKTALMVTDDIPRFRRRLDRRLKIRKPQDDSSSRNSIC